MRHLNTQLPSKLGVKFSGLALVCLLTALTVAAATPFTDYQARVTRAATLAQALTAIQPLTAEQITQLQTLKELLPAQEEIEAADQLIHVDNRWLHEALDKLTQSKRTGDATALAARLTALQQRLATTPDATPDATQSQARAQRLDEILARPEYQVAQKQKSKLKEWLEKLQAALRDLFIRLFGNAPRNPMQPSQYTLNFARIAILTFLALALGYALFKLVPRWRRQRREKPAAPGTREILGETFDEAMTTEDLLASARALARQGDFRAAIRRAYIALLHELEQQGKLQLHQAKTNRDYLEALRKEPTTYSSFFALTRIFERIWYGHDDATEFDFEGFLTGYRAALNQAQAAAPETVSAT